ncbi:MAG: 6-phosphogluconolactonase [Candidatus Woesearchaeota archaeon]
MVEIINTETVEELAGEFFKEFENEVRSLPANKLINVALCGGESVPGFYKELGRNIEKLPFERMHFFMLDERIDKKKRNSFVVEENIIKEIHPRLAEFVRENFHYIEDVEEYAEKDPEKIAQFYTDILRKYSPTLTFDIIIASSGEDMHIGSLFPESDLLGLKHKGYAYVSDSPKSPKERITLLPESIVKSKVSFAFFIGKKKRQAYLDFTTKNLSLHKAPIALLNSTKTYLVTDL